MRAALIAMMLMIGSQAGAECGKLCDHYWWKTATAADVQVKTACTSQVPWKPSRQQVVLVGTLQASGSTGSSEATLES